MSTTSESFPAETERVLDRFRQEYPLEEFEPLERAEPRPGRRVPLILFVLTILSTFWAGVTAWGPQTILEIAWQQNSALAIRQSFIANWQTGLVFSAGLISILLAHEMGHYVASRYYRVRATYPIFIPFPFNPFGTCGALIMMDGRTADRREIFDIGIAGPLAGLVVAIPLGVIGLLYPSGPQFAATDSLRLGEPLLFSLLESALGTSVFVAAEGFSTTEASPLLMACWIGLLVTGINMMPMSQLDGGHVTFGLLGERSVWVARAAFLAAAGYVIVMGRTEFAIMLVLVLFLKLRHPPSRDDTRRIGWPRAVLALASLSLPILCIPARPIIGF